MKKNYFLLILTVSGSLVFGKTGKEGTTVNIINSNEKATVVEFKPGAFSFQKVSTPKGDANMLMLDEGTPMLQDGAPELLKLTKSLIIPDMGVMKISVLSSNFYDVPNVEIAPSKGNIKRNIDKDKLPYSYGSIYNQNTFFPAAIAELRSPYIFRDYRGQTMVVYPFQYNPQTKVLRVYTSIKVEVAVQSQTGGENALQRDAGNRTPIDVEFDAAYKKHFINYGLINNLTKTTAYTPIAENGSMMIIADDQFVNDMAPLVAWKNRKGLATTIVKKSTAGTTAAAIKTYITNTYNTNKTLKYVLLVGDAAQLPASSTSYGDSDNNYGYITGSDSYPEVFVGRYSATTSAQVQTMVNRTISYEKTPSLTATYYKNAILIASAEGPGDNNEYDWQHQRLIKTKLLAYKYNNNTTDTYTKGYENFDGSQGVDDAAGDPTASMITTQVNNGAGIITYSGHGSETSFVTTGFSNSNINSLTNTDKWPFIFSVACVNGEFVKTATCFGEAWLRAGSPTAPKGAVATLMATINQSWNPPMKAQDAIIDIITEADKTNIKRTFTGIAMNGCMAMNDSYGNEGREITDTWVTFGDPSTTIFTNTPAKLTATHIATAPVGVTTVTVNCNTEGALVCLSVNGVILGTGTVSNGVATITFAAVNTSGTVIDVTATAYNTAPYFGTVTIGSVGIDALVTNYALSIFPVPANNNLTVQLQTNSTETVNISLVNSLGQVVLSENAVFVNSTCNKTLNISALSSGVYHCRVQFGNTILNKAVTLETSN